MRPHLDITSGNKGQERFCSGVSYLQYAVTSALSLPLPLPSFSGSKAPLTAFFFEVVHPSYTAWPRHLFLVPLEKQVSKTAFFILPPFHCTSPKQRQFQN